MKTPHPWQGMRPWTRHSLVLLVAGLIYVGIGFAFCFTRPTGAKEQALHFALKWWSFQTWGVIFIVAGVLAVISSRWPPVSRTWGYSVLTGLSAAWAAFYGVGIFFADSPTTNLTAGLSWALVAFLWWAISGLRDPDRS
jgi:hypothetical protein